MIVFLQGKPERDAIGRRVLMQAAPFPDCLRPSKGRQQQLRHPQ